MTNRGGGLRPPLGQDDAGSAGLWVPGKPGRLGATMVLKGNVELTLIFCSTAVGRPLLSGALGLLRSCLCAAGSSPWKGSPFYFCRSFSPHHSGEK